METVPSNATAKQLKHSNHSDSGDNTWQSNKFEYTDIYAPTVLRAQLSGVSFAKYYHAVRVVGICELICCGIIWKRLHFTL
jgi:hypothetical protein